MSNNALDFGISSEYVQLLNEIGYVAIGRGLKKDAETVFDALSSIRPNSELPLIGLAVCALNFGKFKEALEILSEKAAKVNPDSDLVKAFFALVLMYSKQIKQCKEIVSEVIKNNKDEAAVSLAKTIQSELK